MDWKKHRWKLLAPLLAIAILAAAFWYGGDGPGLRGWRVSDDSAVPIAEKTAPAPDEFTQQEQPVFQDETGPASQTEESSEAVPEAPMENESAEPSKIPGASETIGTAGGKPETEPAAEADVSPQQGMVIDTAAGKDQYQTDPVPEGKPLLVEPGDVLLSDAAHTCTLSVRCDTILNNLDWLDPEKTDLGPEDGVIFPVAEAVFYEGESVFNVLQRELKQAGIHMEFSDTTAYNSAYIEGIHKLFEFDCGELSGWMYKVNGWFPNYGCSRYQLREGGVVEWICTCDLGKDVGGRGAMED